LFVDPPPSTPEEESKQMSMTKKRREKRVVDFGLYPVEPIKTPGERERGGILV